MQRYVKSNDKAPFNLSLWYLGWFLLDLLAALPFDLLYATCMFESLVSCPSLAREQIYICENFAHFIAIWDWHHDTRVLSAQQFTYLVMSELLNAQIELETHCIILAWPCPWSLAWFDHLPSSFKYQVQHNLHLDRNFSIGFFRRILTLLNF